MQESKLLKISWIILTVAIAFSMVWCVWVMIVGSPFMPGIFEGYIGEPWSEFLEQQPKQAALYGHLTRLHAGDAFVGSLFALLIVSASYRKGEKWAWSGLLIGTIMSFGSIIVFASMFSDPAGIALGIVGLCIGLVALLIPVKEIWSAKEGQTA